MASKNAKKKRSTATTGAVSPNSRARRKQRQGQDEGDPTPPPQRQNPMLSYLSQTATSARRGGSTAAASPNRFASLADDTPTAEEKTASDTVAAEAKVATESMPTTEDKAVADEASMIDDAVREDITASEQNPPSTATAAVPPNASTPESTVPPESAPPGQPATARGRSARTGPHDPNNRESSPMPGLFNEQTGQDAVPDDSYDGDGSGTMADDASTSSTATTRTGSTRHSRPVQTRLWADRAPPRKFTSRCTLKFAMIPDQQPNLRLIRTITEWFEKVSESDDKFCILPWGADSELTGITKPSELPERLQDIKNYFQRARPLTNGGNLWISVRVSHDVAFSDLVMEFDWWLKLNKHAFYRNNVQAEKTRNLGWALYSLREMSCDTLATYFLNEHKLELGLRWRVISTGVFIANEPGKTAENLPYAIHFEVSDEQYSTAKRLLTHLYGHRKVHVNTRSGFGSVSSRT